jgi:hypothetical protein
VLRTGQIGQHQQIFFAAIPAQRSRHDAAAEVGKLASKPLAQRLGGSAATE